MRQKRAVNRGVQKVPVLIDKQKKEFQKFEKNMKWFQNNYEKLRDQYAGEYVAVNDGKVVLHDENARALITKLRKKHEDLGAFVIEFVSKEKIELIL